MGVVPNSAESVSKLIKKMRAVIQGLQSLRGIAKVSAVSIVAELGEISRFDKPRQLMGYSGVVSSEDSSGEDVRRGPISKAGIAHLRRIVVEAAWSYRHRPNIGATLAARQQDRISQYGERFANYPGVQDTSRTRDWQSQACRRENCAHFFEGEVKTRKAFNGTQSQAVLKDEVFLNVASHFQFVRAAKLAQSHTLDRYLPLAMKRTIAL